MWRHLSVVGLFAVTMSVSALSVANDKPEVTQEVTTNFSQIGLANNIVIYGIPRAKNDPLAQGSADAYLQTVFTANAVDLNENIWDDVINFFSNDGKTVVVRMDADFKNELGKMTRVLASMQRDSSGEEFNAAWQVRAIPPWRLQENSYVELSIAFLETAIEADSDFYKEIGGDELVALLAPATAPLVAQSSKILGVVLDRTTTKPENSTIVLGLSRKAVQKFGHLVIVDEREGDASTVIGNSFENGEFEPAGLSNLNYIHIQLEGLQRVLAKADAPFLNNAAIEELFKPFMDEVAALGDDYQKIARVCQRIRDYASHQFGFSNEDLAILGLYVMSRRGTYSPVNESIHRRSNCFTDREWQRLRGNTNWDPGGCSSKQCETARLFTKNWYAGALFGAKGKIFFETGGAGLSTSVSDFDYDARSLIETFRVTKFGDYDGRDNLHEAHLCVRDPAEPGGVKAVKATVRVDTVADADGKPSYLVGGVTFGVPDNSGFCELSA